MINRTFMKNIFLLLMIFLSYTMLNSNFILKCQTSQTPKLFSHFSILQFPRGKIVYQHHGKVYRRSVNRRGEKESPPSPMMRSRKLGHVGRRSYWAYPDAFQLTPFPFSARYALPFFVPDEEDEEGGGRKKGHPGRKVFIATSESVLTSLGKRWRWRSGKERVQVSEQRKVEWRGE